RRCQATFLSGFGREKKKTERFLGRSLVAQDQPFPIRRPVDPGMAPKAETIGPGSGQLALSPAERRHEEDSISVRRTAIEGDRAAVRRPDRIYIVSGIIGQPDPIAAVHEPDVDVLVIVFFSAPDKCDLVAVRRKSGLSFASRIGGQRNDIDRRASAAVG